MAAVMIGVDPHKASHTAVAIGAAGRPGPCRGRRAAIERSDGPVVDALFDAGITVVVISPNQVKNLPGRYGSAGNKDDRFDAFVLADTLRTDRARLRPLTPDSPATVALRRACRARKDLVSHRVGLANQLRAHLRNALPGAVGLFKEIDSPVSLAFLARFDSQDRADWLTPARLGKWLASRRHQPHRAARPPDRRAPRCHRRRQRSQRLHHPRSAGRPGQPDQPDQDLVRADR